MSVDAARGSDDEPGPIATLYWVAAYLTHRVFAGHEEGGWWTDVGELVTEPDIYQQLVGFPAGFLTEDGAEVHADRLRTRLPDLNKGRRPLCSVLSEGVYDVLVIAAPTLPSTYPECLPRYE